MKNEQLNRFSDLFSLYTELRLQENRGINVVGLNGNIVVNSQTSSSGMSVRAFKNGVWGFASSADQSDDSIKACIQRASENADFLSSKSGKGAVTLPAFTGKGAHGNYAQEKDASQKELIEFIQDLNAYAEKKYPALQQRVFALRGDSTERRWLTSDGADAYTYVSRTNLIMQFQLIKDGEPIELYDIAGGNGQFKDFFSSPDKLYAKIDTLVDELNKKANGVFAKPGIHEVVLGPDLAGILAHEAIGHTTESDFVLAGSVAADYMNKSVASPLITLVDFAYEYKGQVCPTPIWIDDEGVAGRDCVIIKDGILTSYMHNKQSAAHFGVNPTGNARANDFSDEPLVRMRNTAILPGKDKLADMIASIDDGYYFVRSSNGQADSTSEFMFGVVVGYEIKNGKIGQAVRDCTISGIAFDMLKTVTMVSDDMVWSNGGHCGKKQSIQVGMGGPAIKCKINVGGRA